MSHVRTALLAPGAKPVHASEGKGINETWRGDLHLLDGTTVRAYIKFIDKCQFVNELLAGELARLVGFQVPTHFFVQVYAADYADKFRAFGITTDRVLAFGVESVEGKGMLRRFANEGPRFLEWFVKTCKNWRQVISFDVWIANIDRHFDNLLVGGSGEFWLIDHGLAFTGQSWKPADLIPAAETVNRLYNDLGGILTLGLRKEILDEVQLIQTRCIAVDISGAIEDSDTHLLAAPDERTALEAYLSVRRSLLDNLVSRLVGIPALGHM